MDIVTSEKAQPVGWKNLSGCAALILVAAIKVNSNKDYMTPPKMATVRSWKTAMMMTITATFVASRSKRKDSRNILPTKRRLTPKITPPLRPYLL
jgi:hypothetical protein